MKILHKFRKEIIILSLKYKGFLPMESRMHIMTFQFDFIVGMVFKLGGGLTHGRLYRDVHG